MMRPVHSREEYLSLRNGGEQRSLVTAIRNGNEGLKHKLLQMNYSCLPNEDGTLKGSKRMSTTVGMDIDHLSKEEMPQVRDRILSKKDELGLKMLEKSARGGGYHLVFARRPELTQEENLKWASELLGVKYDDGAKDITRVFFTTTEAELIYLDDEVFGGTEVRGYGGTRIVRGTRCEVRGTRIDSTLDNSACKSDLVPTHPRTSAPPKNSSSAPSNSPFPLDYHGIPFTDIIAKYWELNNHGFEPTVGDRDTLTYQLACDLRHICGKNADWLDQVIPCYNGFPVEEKRAKIKSALSSEYNGFPLRLRNTLNAIEAADNRGQTRTDDAEICDSPCESAAEENLRALAPSKLPQGIRESIDAVGPTLAMPVVTAICPCIGTLATGVQLDVHGTKRGLNLISYIAGDFASAATPAPSRRPRAAPRSWWVWS